MYCKMRKQISKEESTVNEKSSISFSTYNITWKLISRIFTFLKKDSNGRLCCGAEPVKCLLDMHWKLNF